MGSAINSNGIPGAKSNKWSSTDLPSMAPGNNSKTNPNFITPARIVQPSRKLGFDELNKISGTAASDVKIASKGTIEMSINRFLTF
jgi:hypothetical protein